MPMVRVSRSNKVRVLKQRLDAPIHIEFEAVYRRCNGDLIAVTPAGSWFLARADVHPAGSISDYVELFGGIRSSDGRLELFRDNWRFLGTRDSDVADMLVHDKRKVRLDKADKADVQNEFNRRFAIAVEAARSQAEARGADVDLVAVRERIARELNTHSRLIDMPSDEELR